LTNGFWSKGLTQHVEKGLLNFTSEGFDQGGPLKFPGPVGDLGWLQRGKGRPKAEITSADSVGGGGGGVEGLKLSVMRGPTIHESQDGGGPRRS